MIYGVKVIHTHTVEDEDQRFYEELILMVQAESFDEAYEKAEQHMRDEICDYINIYGKRVKTHNIEAVDCYLALDPEGDVQEVYSSFSMNRGSLIEDEYYSIIADQCEEKDLRPLRNKDFN